MKGLERCCQRVFALRGRCGRGKSKIVWVGRTGVLPENCENPKRGTFSPRVQDRLESEAKIPLLYEETQQGRALNDVKGLVDLRRAKEGLKEIVEGGANWKEGGRMANSEVEVKEVGSPTEAVAGKQAGWRQERWNIRWHED